MTVQSSHTSEIYNIGGHTQWFRVNRYLLQRSGNDERPPIAYTKRPAVVVLHVSIGVHMYSMHLIFTCIMPRSHLHVFSCRLRATIGNICEMRVGRGYNMIVTGSMQQLQDLCG